MNELVDINIIEIIDNFNVYPVERYTVSNKPIKDFLESSKKDITNQSLIFIKKYKLNSVIVGKIIRKRHDATVEIKKETKFIVEHWNWHPLRKSMCFTHTTEEYLTDINKSAKATFNSIERLFSI